MNTSERSELEQEEAERAPEQAGPEQQLPTPAENVLGLQRSAGNAAVCRRLRATPGTRGAPRRRAVPDGDHALGRMLARTAAQRSGVKERDPGAEAEATAPEPEEPDELEAEEEVGPEAEAGAEQAKPAGTKTALARKTKAPPVPKIKPKTKFKAPSGGRSRTDVGVGEEVTFTSNVAGAWTASGGTPAASVANGKKFNWTASDRAASITITLTAGTQTATTTMTVIEPMF